MRKRITIDCDNNTAVAIMRTLVDFDLSFEVNNIPDLPNKPVVVLDTKPGHRRGGKPGRLVVAKDGRRVDQVVMDKALSFGNRKFPIAEAANVAVSIGFAKSTTWNAIKRLVVRGKLERLNATDYRVPVSALDDANVVNNPTPEPVA